MSYAEWYLLIGFVVALIFAGFFTKIVVIKKSSDKDGNKKIVILHEKPAYFLSLSRFIIILTNVDNDFSLTGFTKLFQLKLGLLFLINILIWPISFFILILMVFTTVFGKRFTISNTE